LERIMHRKIKNRTWFAGAVNSLHDWTTLWKEDRVPHRIEHKMFSVAILRMLRAMYNTHSNTRATLEFFLDYLLAEARLSIYRLSCKLRRRGPNAKR